MILRRISTWLFSTAFCLFFIAPGFAGAAQIFAIDNSGFLYDLDPGTAARTVIGSTVFTNLSGLAGFPSCPESACSPFQNRKVPC